MGTQSAHAWSFQEALCSMLMISRVRTGRLPILARVLNIEFMPEGTQISPWAV